MFFQPFIKELAGNLNSKNIILKLDGFNRKEPGLKTLIIYIVLYNLKAIFPNF